MTMTDERRVTVKDICDDCMQKIRDFVRMVPPVRQEPDRPGSNVPKQPTVPPMPKGFKIRGLEGNDDDTVHESH